MKAKITKVTFNKEYESNFGTLFGFIVEYDGKSAYYSSKTKDQKKFIVGQEAEFTEEVRKGDKGNEYIIIKPVYAGKGQSNYGKALSREQSRYSGFSDSYVKDLLISGIIKPEVTTTDEDHNDIVMITWKKRAMEIFEHMVELDKTLKS